jgi:2'-5' RNA ligase
MSELPPQVRAFVAVPLPEDLIAQIALLQKRLKAELRDVSWTRREAMHLTLQFLGTVESSSLPALTDALRVPTAKTKSFRVDLAGVGSFGNRVLWVGVGAGREPLRALAAAVTRATRPFTEERESRDFNAHVTLGRLRAPSRGIAAALRAAAVPDFQGWIADHFELIRSELSPQGSRYTTLTSFPLEA